MPKQNNNVTILIIEDDPTIRETMAYLLEKEGFIITSAGTSREGLKIVENTAIDLLLLDVMLPDVDGFTVCDLVRKANADIKIIIVSALSEKDDVIKGLSLGADDYITKPYNVDELIVRIKANLRRGSGSERSSGKIAGAVPGLEIADIKMDLESHSVMVAGKKAALTMKEFSILQLLIENPNKAFTRRELASQVWHEENQGVSRTVDAHINNLRTKVERLSAYKLIETIHGFGYKLNVHKKVERQ